jgi:hypothetical protein
MRDKSAIETRFLEAVGKPLRRGAVLSDFSSFRIGGPADFFYEVSGTGDLKAAVEFARRETVPFYVIGGGYNILFADAGYRGLIVRNRAQGIASGPEPDRIVVSSGTPLSRLLQYALDNHFSGFEFLAGIPGRSGGRSTATPAPSDTRSGNCSRKRSFWTGKGMKNGFPGRIWPLATGDRSSSPGMRSP